MGFVHLHCHSAYSLLEGTATLQALIAMAKKWHMPAIALTDHNNLYGVVHFYLQAQKAGIKPVIGMEVELDDGSRLVLLARNMDGYRNLCHLATGLRLHASPDTFSPAGFDDEEPILPWDAGMWGVPVFGFTGRPPAQAATSPKEAALPMETVLSGRHTRGLIALSGGRRGLVNMLSAKGKGQGAARAAGMFLSAFGEGNFFVELDATASPEETRQLADMATGMGIPIVAANDVLYLAQEDAVTAMALAASRKGKGAFRGSALTVKGGKVEAHPDLIEEAGTGRYFRSVEDMLEIFRDYPQAVANTRFIAEQCNVELPLHKPLFPSVPLGGETPFSRLWKLCFAGATRHYRPLTAPVISLLKHELEVIDKLDFCTYFLVVHDIALFARHNDIPIMARGSAANSLVAYVLGITQVDPIAHDLLFERFLNTSRAEFELPDVDLDLCWRRRDEVLHYVYERYGRDHVAIVGTHITFRLRSAWREMAKALGIAPERISRLSNRLSDVKADEESSDTAEDPGIDSWDPPNIQPPDPAPPLPNLRDETERAAFSLARAIEGLPRHAGMHCGGVVISPGPLADLVPLQRSARDPDMAITQFEKDGIESMGLVKMDLLGSRALTTLVDALQASGLAKGHSDVHKALEQIPYDDEATYRLMSEANTLGCFQLESPGMRGLLKWLRPRSMKDVAAAISLFRPGPMEGGFLETFMRRHLRQEIVTYPHPSMEPYLRETYGVILYQEQFLRLAHVLAGLDLGDAEKLRKDLGKARTAEERTRLGSWFVAGAIERGIDQLQAEKVWEVVSGYTGFGFCKAHACSYALTAYRSAYMKAHYPAHYMAAQINNMGGFYGPSVYLEDARRMGVEVLPPHVNMGGALCEVSPRTRSIRFGLNFVKGLSERTVSSILTEKRSGGPFRSLPDLMQRVQIKPPEITALVKVGACDNLGPTGKVEEAGDNWSSMVFGQPLNRRQLMWLLPSLLMVRKAKARGAIHRSSGLEALATGSEGMQGVMGDVMGHDGTDGTPKILGGANLHIEVPHMEDYTTHEKLCLEREALGFSVSSNEMDLHRALSTERGAVPSSKLAGHAGREASVSGIIVAGRSHHTKDGEKMLFVTLQDGEGLVEVVLFAEAYRENKEALANHGYGPYLVRGTVQVSGKGRGIGVQPPADLRPADAVTLKMHPVLIAERVEPLAVGD